MLVLDSKQLSSKLGISETTTLSLLDKKIIHAVKGTTGRRKWHIPEFFVSLFEHKAKGLYGDKPTAELCNMALQAGALPYSNKSQAKVLCFGNIKGGIGKTSVSTNMAYILAMLDQRILVIDMDAQSNTTDFLLMDDEELSENIGIKQLLEMSTKRIPITKEQVVGNIIKTTIAAEGMVLDIMPAELGLARQIEVGRAAADNPHKVLRKIIDLVRDDYDFIIIDTPPAPGLSLQMSIYASDEIVLITEASKKSVKGLLELIKEVKYSENEFEKKVILGSIFVNKHKATTNIQRIFTKQVVDIAHEHSILGVYAIRATAIEEEASATNTPLIIFKRELDSNLETVSSLIEHAVEQIISKDTTWQE